MHKFFLFFSFLLTVSALAAQSIPADTAAIIKPHPVFKTGVIISGVTLICKGSETLLKVEGEYESFEWNTGSSERMIKVYNEGIYEVTVKTKSGCTFTSSVNVQVRPCL